MCGIAGSFNISGDCLKEDNFNKNILSVLNHRGPDDNGSWRSQDNRTLLFHNRLSIIDLSSAGHQPMHSNNDRYVISFNGEIYNHEEIRKELLKTKLIFNGSSDTEILLESFSTWGIEQTLKKVNGMFAIALYDKNKRKLTLMRDRIGEKPIYYGVIDDNLYFCSELKGFSCIKGFSKEIDNVSVDQFLKYGFIPAPRSIFKNIYKLKPGHFIEFSDSSYNQNQICYWDLKSKIQENHNKKLPKNEALKTIHSLLIDSIDLRMKTDVSTGSFLSSGIDSSLVTAIAQNLSDKKFESYTIGFNKKDFDESEDATNIAKYLGTQHHKFMISDKELLDIVPKLPEIYCEPFSDESQIPSILVSNIARQNVKVILSGDGGDEIFGGYNRHIAGEAVKNGTWLYKNSIKFLLKNKNLQPSVIKILNKFGRKINLEQLRRFNSLLSNKPNNKIYEELLSIKNSAICETPDALNSDFIYLDSVENVMAYDQLFYLPDNILVKLDRASMSCNLETRVPFLDHRIVETGWQINLKDKINSNVGKVILRDILNKYLPNKLFTNNKKGFNVPISDWLKAPLKEWASSLLFDRIDCNYLDIEMARDLWHKHQNDSHDNSKELWNILTFLAWHDHWLSK
tara:strand:+ start:2736 stop:4613 length:1878 start_codon:yes stop_codon:yes gene_type:complete